MRNEYGVPGKLIKLMEYDRHSETDNKEAISIKGV
jgi:hypothetical protein